mmetsp:Transcript_21766/g.50217  ORF Transcript_21766/g.50217 Transcript_21766/m.50217 type:complete len:227 (+) Transcript_21766:564-1244(+)
MITRTPRWTRFQKSPSIGCVSLFLRPDIVLARDDEHEPCVLANPRKTRKNHCFDTLADLFRFSRAAKVGHSTYVHFWSCVCARTHLGRRNTPTSQHFLEKDWIARILFLLWMQQQRGPVGESNSRVSRSSLFFFRPRRSAKETQNHSLFLWTRISSYAKKRKSRAKISSRNALDRVGKTKAQPRCDALLQDLEGVGIFAKKQMYLIVYDSYCDLRLRGIRSFKAIY